MRLSDLQAKKIVSIVSGKNLGNIIDIEIGEDGKFNYLLIEKNKNIFSLNRDGDLKVFCPDITKIGEDVILVRKD